MRDLTKYRCPSCQVTVTIPVEMLGQSVCCGACGELFLAPPVLPVRVVRRLRTGQKAPRRLDDVA